MGSPMNSPSSDNLFSEGCDTTYRKVFSDDSPETWCWLGYQGKTLIPYACGCNGLGEMMEKVQDDTIMYGFLRINRTDDGGDSKQVKFVFITWVGEYSPPLKKGKVALHKKHCETLFKGFHIQKQLNERDGIKDFEQEIESSLRQASGANYDLGNTRLGIQAGGSIGLKSASKKFFQEKEQETEIKQIVYNKGPLGRGISKCDIGGRSFVAMSTEAKKNIIGYDEK